MEWPDNSIPKAEFKASTTLAAPNEEITFESIRSVKLTAKNKFDEADSKVEGFITISKKVSGKLSLLSKDKTAEASSFVNDKKSPQFA